MKKPAIRILSLLILAAAAPLGAQESADKKGPDPTMKYAIAIHGGAGSSPKNFSDEANQRRYQSMQRALELGSKILRDGGSSLDAVESVVRLLEDDPQFNAGKGAVFNAVGGHELDASIMDGSNGACGAVAGVTRVKNPISLARLVMRETPHVLLVGEGAEQFAEQQAVPLVDPKYFDTPASFRAWQESREKKPEAPRSQIQLQDADVGSYYGTVGCVALDFMGNLAAGTSTGGLTNKRYGRVGDTPIVGAGTYADNQTCAVSCTGIGEQFIRHAVAYDIAAQMRYRGSSLQQAVEDQLVTRLNDGDGGIIAVDKQGNVWMNFNTHGMARAAADSTGRFEVHWHDDLDR